MNESDNTISGPYLPCCFTHNSNSYIMIGIILGILGCIHM